jgi:hypothetical protein
MVQHWPEKLQSIWISLLSPCLSNLEFLPMNYLVCKFTE